MQTQAPASAPSLRPAGRRRPYRALTLSALAIATLVGSASPATAGPDDGKIVTTGSHIDAPKTYWEEGRFILKNEAPYQGESSSAHSTQQSMIWLGKGWGRYNEKQQYIYTVGKTPAQSFLGQAGDLLYMSPDLTSGNNDPAWVGYGADTEIPTDTFRDGTFALDLLSVQGPGAVEMFRFFGEGNQPADTVRMLSSTTPGLNSAKLTRGSHTHNYTTFTTPGRYQLTYRTVARGLDGSVIQSDPTNIIWQVGGRSPHPGNGASVSLSTQDRYRRAPIGDLSSENYRLTLTPYSGRERDGDQALTQIEFTSGEDDLEGTLTLFNQGYFLTDLPVEKGHAQWVEMLGSHATTLQAVFTPSTPGDARWVSPELTYRQGQTSSVDSQVGEGSWPIEKPNHRNIHVSTEPKDLTSGNFSATITPHPAQAGYSILRVETQDKTFRGFLGGGFYHEENQYPTSDFEGHFIDGVAEFIFEDDSFHEGEKAIVQVIPHPDMNVHAASLKLADSYSAGHSYQQEGSMLRAVGVPERTGLSPSPSVTPGQMAPSGPSSQPVDTGSLLVGGQQCLTPEYRGRYLLNRGHLDIRARLAEGQLSLILQDETGLVSPSSIERSLEQVVMAIGSQAQRTRTSRMMSPDLDFLGPEGSTFYGLPALQQSGLVWPGWSTQDVDYAQLAGPVTLHLVPVEMPDGASYGVYEQDFAGAVTLHAGGATKDTTIDIDFATHAHANWVFTDPGVYGFDVYYSAPLPDGTTARSETQRAVFAVGGTAIDDCLAATESAPSPGPSQQPTAQPTVQPSGESSAQPSEQPTAGVGGPGSAPAAGSSTLPGAGEPADGVRATDNDGAAGGVGGAATGQSGTGQSQQASGSGGSLASTGASVLGVGAAGALALGAGVLTLRRRQR